MNTIVATMVGIDKIHMTWDMIFWMSAVTSGVMLVYLTADRLLYIIKRQPIYQLIRDPKIIKSTMHDCIIGKTINPNDDRSLFQSISVIMTIYTLIAVLLLILKGLCLRNGISEYVINSSEIRTLLMYL